MHPTLKGILHIYYSGYASLFKVYGDASSYPIRTVQIMFVLYFTQLKVMIYKR